VEIYGKVNLMKLLDQASGYRISWAIKQQVKPVELFGSTGLF